MITSPAASTLLEYVGMTSPSHPSHLLLCSTIPLMSEVTALTVLMTVVIYIHSSLSEAVIMMELPSSCGEIAFSSSATQPGNGKSFMSALFAACLQSSISKSQPLQF